MSLDDLCHPLRRAVGRLTVNNDDLEPLGIVILCDQLSQRPLDKLRLVSHGHDDGDEQRLCENGRIAVVGGAQRRGSVGVICRSPVL